jgi:predicted nucleic acid-binding protein
VIVVDASALVDAIDGRSTVVERITGRELHAPHLLDVEVASALRKLVASGRWSDRRADLGLSLLESAAIRRHPHRPLLRLAWSLRDHLSSYDAIYVALATALGAPLVTTDRKLAGAPALPCQVQLVG